MIVTMKYATETKLGDLRAKCIEELARKRGLDEIEALVIDNRLLTLIKIISTGLGEDMNLNIVPGDRWKYNTETNEIIFPVELLLTSTPEEIIGFSAHEAGHRQISRHNLRKAVFKRFFSREYLRLLLNAFEDSRVDNWLISVYKGIKHYLDVTYDDLLPENISISTYVDHLRGEIAERANVSCHPFLLYPNLEYLLGMRYYWRYGRLPAQIMNSEVRGALERTSGDFDEIFNHYPPGRVSELERMEYAEEVALMIRDKILPEYEHLVRITIEKLVNEIKNNTIQIKQKKCAQEDLSPSELEEEARKLLEMDAKELANKFSQKTEKQVIRKADHYRKGASEEKETLIEGGESQEERKTESVPAETLRDLIKKQRIINREQDAKISEYERVYKLISNLIHALSGVLENHFSKNKRPSFQGYFPSGQKPDLRRAMELSRKLSEGIPVQEKDLRVFLKRRLPTQRDHKIVLALDESASMEEPKRTSALAGLLVFMEALDHIGIDYAVIGFSDSPVMHKNFGKKLGPSDRRLLFEEVSMYIPGGSTADADTLQLATNILKDQPEDSSRWIIMVTDGEGNVNTTGKTFDVLQKEALGQKIEVLGVGLGEEVTEVIKRYKNGVQIDDVEELPAVLSRILEEKLVTQDVFWANFLTPRNGGKNAEALTTPSLPQDVSELLASIYLNQKQNIPSFNVRHLKRASELLGYLLNKGYPVKEGFGRSLKYAFIDTLDQPQRVRDLLLEDLSDIQRILPDFTPQDVPQDMYLPSARAEVPVSSIPHDLEPLLDIMMKNNTNPEIEKALSLLKELISSSDIAFVCIPGLEACFRIIQHDLIKEITVEELEKKLEDKSWAVRQPAAMALGRVYLLLIKQGKEAEMSALEKALNDEDPTVCRAAAQALGRIWYYYYRKGKITLEELEHRLENANWAFRQAAVRALGQIYPALVQQGNDVDISKLEHGLWNKNWFVRQAESEALGQIYPALIKQGMDIDLSRLEDKLKDNIVVRQAAALALGQTYPSLIKRGKEVSLRVLEERLDDNDWSVRQAASQALGRIWYHSYYQGKMELKEIEEKLEDFSWSVRQAACQALGQIYPALIREGRSVNLKKLEERLWDADVDRSVCQAAAQALGRIWPHSYTRKKITVKALEDRLKSENWFLHQAAALALVQIHHTLIQKGKEADLSKLERRLKDKIWSVRQAAARASIKSFSDFISRNEKEFGKVLDSFNEMLGEPMKSTLSGTHSKQVQVGEKTFTVGNLVFDRVLLSDDIPDCVMTASGYHIIETLCIGYILKHSILLLGPTSTGKSFLIKWLAKVLGYEHLSYSINPYTSKFEIIGGVKPDNKGKFVWQDGILLNAAREGLWLAFEEINLASSEVVEILNDYLITGKISYSANGEQKELYPHPDFRLFATGNPESYSQRQKLSEVFLSRFKILYQKELSEEELSQILSSLFDITSSLALPIARFHTTLQNQADSRIIGKAEKDPYTFTLRDIIRLGKRLEPILAKGAMDGEYLKKFFLEFFSVYIGRLRDESEKDAVISLLDTHFGFREKGMDLEALFMSSSEDLTALLETVPSTLGNEFIPREDADIIPTPTQRTTLYLILKALIQNEPVLVVGNPASGKTTLIRYLARKKETNLYYVNLSSDTGLEELLGGYTQDKSGKWHYRKGLLFSAIEEGSWLLIDEANLSPLSEYLNSLLDFGYVIDGEENIWYAHPNFRIFLAINPPAIHQSRNLLSPALRSRFTEVWVEELTNLGELAGLIDTWGASRGAVSGAQDHRKSKKRKGREKVIQEDVKKGKKLEQTPSSSFKRFTHFSA